MAVKMDMSKAYDRVEWDFLAQVMTRLGFHSRWINWVMQCVTTVSYSFLINDSIYGKVKPHRGIRQGDPISPYLFILSGEVLSGLCRHAELDGSMRGVRVARGSPRVNHLLFADDTMMFCNSTSECCLSMLQILQEYEKVSGQMINISKSSITFSVKTPAETKTSAKTILGIQKEGGVGKYLGLPEHFGRRKKDLFTSIVDRIRQRASNWSTRFLSRAGKLTMLKAILTAIPTYAMSCFQLPKNLCNRIQSALTRFWWDESTDKKKMCWVAWEKLTKPKAVGGLGLRDIQLFNQALLAKVAWRILTNPSCLLARVLTGKYCHKRSFLEAQLPAVCSHGWRSILHGRDLLLENLGKAIGNGQNTKIWKDSWISSNSQLKPFGPINESALDLRVSDLLTDDLQWNKMRIDQLLPEFSSQIQCIKPSKEGAEDIFVWLPLQTGVYSTKSGYNSQALPPMIPSLPAPINAQSNQEFSWIKDIWSVKTSPKLKIFLWSIIQGALPIGAELQRRGMMAAGHCPRCKEVETSMHTLFLCPFAKEVWKHIPISTPVHIAVDTDFATALVRFRQTICLPHTGVRSPLLPWICWALWTARNRLIFEDKTYRPEEIATKGVSAALEWDQAQDVEKGRNGTHREPMNTMRQNPTSNGETTCFVDAAWDVSTNRAGIAWCIYRDRSPTNLSGSQTVDSVSSPLMAEAIAIRNGIERMIQSDIRSTTIFSDCSTLIRAIVSKSQITEIYGVLQDIHHLSSLFASINFQFISRSQNGEADFLAKRALKAHNPSASVV
ncbi:uncharacterized protein LOC125579275 [Brassica napus]|uniref:uncharacterized protein LOC125579275 n=1 Tax=Brassica napus TaxID=3708 RepID=UPI0020790340|nr:uncharacterized protein LOC125579275 [Brassica napus]